MKKIVEINSVCSGSTGKIMCDLAKKASDSGVISNCYCFFGRGNANKNVNCIKIESQLTFLFHTLIARFGFNGHGSYFATKRLVRKLRNINPDVIHMHNIHGYYLNLKVLFKYLKNEYQGKIIWTLHDCWAFTGHCAYFTLVKCEKWKKECHNCPQLLNYPKELFDTTKKDYHLKKELFTGLRNLTIVTPSIWLKDLVKKSFLSCYNVEVIYNGIDLNVFKPIYDKEIYNKYNIPKDKKIILGVANIWEERKGLNDFIELNKVLDLSKYQIVLVGVNKSDLKRIPNTIVSIQKTENALDLAKIYSLATIFFNPTYEDNYPTVNLESIACNTKVVTYNTGGSSESIKEYGYIINNKDYQSLISHLDENYGNFKKLDEISDISSFNSYMNLF